MIFSDKAGMIFKLKNDKTFEIIAEIFDDNGRLIAGLFKKAM